MARNSMSSTITGGRKAEWSEGGTSLYAPSGLRKYLNAAERGRALAAMSALEEDQELFALTLAWTGARISEVLALFAASFQVDASLVAIRTLKRRRFHIREVPVPPWLMARLAAFFSLQARQRDAGSATARLWPRHRITGWRVIKHVMMVAQVTGVAACPRGLRHSFGVGTVQAGVPLNITQRWMGHARISTTAIYADACGPEELAFAERYWRASSGDGALPAQDGRAAPEM